MREMVRIPEACLDECYKRCFLLKILIWCDTTKANSFFSLIALFSLIYLVYLLYDWIFDDNIRLAKIFFF